MFFFISCSEEFSSPSDTPEAVFESFWEFTDENYVYFDFKNIDWDLQKDIYLAQISDDISEDSLYSVCSKMLAELKDGHCYLNRRGENFEFDYTEGFEIHFDLDLILEKYLNNNFQNLENYTFGIIPVSYTHLTLPTKA